MVVTNITIHPQMQRNVEPLHHAQPEKIRGKRTLSFVAIVKLEGIVSVLVLTRTTSNRSEIYRKSGSCQVVRARWIIYPYCSFLLVFLKSDRSVSQQVPQRKRHGRRNKAITKHGAFAPSKSLLGDGDGNYHHQQVMGLRWRHHRRCTDPQI